LIVQLVFVAVEIVEVRLEKESALSIDPFNKIVKNIRRKAVIDILGIIMPSLHHVGNHFDEQFVLVGIGYLQRAASRKNKQKKQNDKKSDDPH
jgi:hypothetical protein